MKRLKLLLFVVIVLVVGVQISEREIKEKRNKSYETIQPMDEKRLVDSLGNRIEIDKIERVGVCSGSLAHMWQLAGGSIIAATHDVFDYEPVTVDKRTIDLGDLKRVNVEQILASKLDLIILSVSIKGHLKVKEILEKAGIQTAYFEVEDFDQYLSVLHTMTALTKREDLYETNGSDVSLQVKEQLRRKKETHPRILLLRALTTKIKVQNSECMTGRMLKEFGCVNLADKEQKLLESLSLEVILKEDPDDIFITTMGEDEQARQMITKTIYEDSAWSKLRAVKANRCFILPKDLFHNKPNQRWGESYQMLADLLYEQ